MNRKSYEERMRQRYQDNEEDRLQKIREKREDHEKRRQQLRSAPADPSGSDDMVRRDELNNLVGSAGLVEVGPAQMKGESKWTY